MRYAKIRFTSPKNYIQDAYMGWEGSSDVVFYDLLGNVLTPPEVYEVITLDKSPTLPAWTK